MYAYTCMHIHFLGLVRLSRCHPKMSSCVDQLVAIQTVPDGHMSSFSPRIRSLNREPSETKRNTDTYKNQNGQENKIA